MNQPNRRLRLLRLFLYPPIHLHALFQFIPLIKHLIPNIISHHLILLHNQPISRQFIIPCLHYLIQSKILIILMDIKVS